MSEIRCNRCGRIIVFGDMHNKEDYVLIQRSGDIFRARMAENTHSGCVRTVTTDL